MQKYEYIRGYKGSGTVTKMYKISARGRQPIHVFLRMILPNETPEIMMHMKKSAPSIEQIGYSKAKINSIAKGNYCTHWCRPPSPIHPKRLSRVAR